MRLTKEILNKLISEAITVATLPLPDPHEAFLQMAEILINDYGATYSRGYPVTPRFRRAMMTIVERRFSFIIGKNVDKVFWSQLPALGGGVVDLKPRKDMDGEYIYTSDGKIAMDFQPIIDIIEE